MITKLPLTTRKTTVLAMRTILRRRFLPVSRSTSSSASASASATAQMWPSSSSQIYVSANSATMESEWWMQQQQQIAIEDVTKLQAVLEREQQQQKQHNESINEEDLLYKLQLQSSPESAIGFTHVAEVMSDSTKEEYLSVLQQKGLSPTSIEQEEIQLDPKEMDRMIQSLQLSSPESAVGFVHVGELLNQNQKDQLQSHYQDQGKDIPDGLPTTTHHDATTSLNEYDDQLLQQMLFSSCPESAIGYHHAGETLTDTLQTQWQVAQQSQKDSATPLPKTLEEAMQSTEHRPIVVTTTAPPFRVVCVNAEWEGLCGYTQEEAYNKPIGDLLNNNNDSAQTEPNTISTRDAGRRMIQSLKTNPTQPQSALLINYTKEGRQFYNRLQVGPLYNNHNENDTAAARKTTEQEAVVEYLVGVLQEVQQDEVEGMPMAA